MLDLCYVEEITDDIIQTLAKSCLHLEELWLTSRRVTRKAIAQLTVSCRSLKYLYIGHCTDAYLDTLHMCRNLQYLGIENGSSITEAAEERLRASHPELLVQKSIDRNRAGAAVKMLHQRKDKLVGAE